MVATGTGGPLFVQALTYDVTGQVKSQTWQHGAGSRTTHWYDYDNLRRLDQWEAPGDTTFYAYDAKGNRVDEEHIPGGDATTSLYGDSVATDRLTQTNTLSGPETRTSYYGYDPSGAVTGIRHTSSLHLPDTDSLEYSWRGLTRRYLHFDYNALGEVTSNEDWRYRYNAGGEREQKRLYWQQDSAHRIMDHKSWGVLPAGRKEGAARGLPRSGDGHLAAVHRPRRAGGVHVSGGVPELWRGRHREHQAGAGREQGVSDRGPSGLAAGCADVAGVERV
jgi:hypothetical protein